jgi:hypothetical protein
MAIHGRRVRMANTLIKTKSTVTQSPIRSLKCFVAAALAVFVLAAAPAKAAVVTFAGSNSVDGLSASATFSNLPGNEIQVTLVNTFPGDTAAQGDVLSALFFSGLNGLSPVSATAGAGSVEWTGSTSNAPPGPSTLGEDWEYAVVAGAPGGATAGISSVGLSLFGSGNFASPGQTLDGTGYGILSAGYAGSDQDGLGNNPYILNTMVFVLSNFTGSVSSITNVSFQYGSDTSEPNIPGVLVPEPGAVTLAAVGILFVGLLQRKRR